MLQKTFKARFYDGINGQGITVDVTWLEQQVLIDHITADGNRMHQEWSKDKFIIKTSSSAIISFTYVIDGINQQLDITDQAFIQSFRALNKPMKKPASPGFRLMVVLLSVVSLMVLFYFMVLPALADCAAGLFPKEYEISLGNQMAEAQLQQEKIDSTRTQYINQFFQQLNVPHDYPIKIVVVDQNIPNAFAMPGGHIVVYSKMLDMIQDENALAALLCHEFSHVQLKHTTRGIFRNLAGSLFLTILFSDAGGITGVIVRNGQQLNALSYTRELEAEADENALKILAANRIPTNGMIHLFKTLKKAGGPEVNEMLSTHPDLDNRIKAAKDFKVNEPPIKNDSLTLYFEKLKGKDWN